MKLVIDANIIFSALIAYNQTIVELFFSKELEIIAPEYILQEIEEHKEEILEKTGYTSVDFEIILSLLYSRIELVPFSAFEEEIKEAKQSCPDPDEIEYFALALRFQCTIWSNDKRLKEQTRVKIISSHELLSIIKASKE